MRAEATKKDPRREKLRDFRKRGKRPCGGKRCGTCGNRYHGWIRGNRRTYRQSLMLCLRHGTDGV